MTTYTSLCPWFLGWTLSLWYSIIGKCLSIPARLRNATASTVTYGWCSVPTISAHPGERAGVASPHEQSAMNIHVTAPPTAPDTRAPTAPLGGDNLYCHKYLSGKGNAAAEGATGSIWKLLVGSSLLLRVWLHGRTSWSLVSHQEVISISGGSCFS